MLKSIVLPLLYCTALLSCAGDTSSPDTIPVVVSVASVDVAAAAPTVEIGSSVQLTATTRDANGAVLTGRAVTWSSNTPYAAVSSTGLVTALGIGEATITAASEGRIGSRVVNVTVPPNVIMTGVRNADAFFAGCPTADPIYATLRQDFAFYIDGQPNTTAVTCTQPFHAMSNAAFSDELIALQTLRLMYYMSANTAGKLPWTPLGLYDWMKASVGGINFHTAPGVLSCCTTINGKHYINLSRQTEDARAYYRTLAGLLAKAGLYAHEARHVTGPGHVNGCPAFPLPTDSPGCDQTYDLNNLGSYGVQYWFHRNLASVHGTSALLARSKPRNSTSRPSCRLQTATRSASSATRRPRSVPRYRTAVAVSFRSDGA